MSRKSSENSYWKCVGKLYIRGIDDEQRLDITKVSVLPIFEFTYLAENEGYSNRSESSFMNQKKLEICVKVLLNIE